VRASLLKKSIRLDAELATMMDRIEADGVAAGLSSDEIFARQIDKILNANGMLSLDMRPCMHVSVTLGFFLAKD
jgi:hypothetical protein